VAELLKVRAQAAQRYVDRLVEKGVVEEVTGGTYGRVWVCRGLINIIESDDPSGGSKPAKARRPVTKKKRRAA
jgi:hypothetical protein